MGNLLLLLALLFSVDKISFAGDTISPTQFLKYGDTIVSSGGVFEMGFFSPTNSSHNIYLGIWYNQTPIGPVVWVANRDTPLNNTSSVALQIISPSRLALVDGNGAEIWRTNASRLVPNPVAKLLDSGNLVVIDANDDNLSNLLWQSFDYPTDTLLPGMRIGRNFVTGFEISVSAWKTETDPGTGQYRTSFDPTGFPQIVFWKGGNKMYRSGPWTGYNWRDLEKWGLFVETSVIINATEVMTGQVFNTSKLIRFVLTSTGTLQFYMGENGTGKWNSFPIVPQDGCDKYGICGPYGSCDNNKSPVCGCLDKFVPRDTVLWGSSDFSGGCVRRTPLNNSSSDGFKRYSGLKLPDTNVSTSHKNMTLQDCNHACFNNLSCMAYSTLIISNGENGCLLWFDDLIDIRVVIIHEDGQDLYIRMASSDLDYPSRSKGKKLKIIKLTSSILGGILVLSLTSTLIIILCRRKRKKIQLNLKCEEDQTLFEVLTITRATDNFSQENKIGEGGYGPVYKGILDDGKEIAVKRLSKTSKQGLEEFKNEVNSIAKLQHRNLVKLLGWDTISPTQSLKYGDTIVSSGGVFEMGFFSPTNSSHNIYLGIWYSQIPIRTVVWVANRDTPLTNTSSLAVKIISPAQLALVDGNNNANSWHTNSSSSKLAPNPVAKLLDSGNLVVTDANDDNAENLLWQSFDHPTDTLLPGMKLGRNLVTGLDTALSAWKSEKNPGNGEYKLCINPTGYPQLVLRKDTTQVFRSGPWNGLRWSGSTGTIKKNSIAETFVIANINEVSVSYKACNTSNLVRLVLTISGSVETFVWGDGTGQWNGILAATDVCDSYGLCGAHGSCNANYNPLCECLPKFLPRDPVGWGRAHFSGGCVRGTPLSCQNDGFLKYSDIKLPDTEVSWFNSSMNLQECEQVCLKNCSCMAYSSLDISNGENGCLLWFGDLMDIKVVPFHGQDLYIRMAFSDLETQNNRIEFNIDWNAGGYLDPDPDPNILVQMEKEEEQSKVDMGGRSNII
nr:G-type lectin S-receptor-like serine/threonine-protein kinase At4g27290 [Ipomoea batatas]